MLLMEVVIVVFFVWMIISVWMREVTPIRKGDMIQVENAQKKHVASHGAVAAYANCIKMSLHQVKRASFCGLESLKYSDQLTAGQLRPNLQYLIIFPG